jgi:hypothetical protein
MVPIKEKKCIFVATKRALARDATVATSGDKVTSVCMPVVVATPITTALHPRTLQVTKDVG